MGVLTWRNVDAPDFRPAMEGFRMFSDQLNNAFSTAKAGLNEFDRSQSDVANKVFNAELLKYQDPAQYKQALASGELFKGIDFRRLSDQSLQHAGQYVGTLMDREYKGLQTEDLKGDLGEETYQRGRSHADDEHMDAAAPILAQYAQLRATNKDADAQALLADAKNAEILGKLKPGQFAAGIRAGQELRSGEQNIRNSDQTYQQDDWRFKNIEQLGFNEGREANTLAIQLAQSATDEGELNALLAKPEYSGKYSSTVLLKARETALGIMGGGLNPIDGTIANLAGGSGGAGPGNALELTYGGGSLPANIKTVGDVVANKGQLVRSLGASPVGVYQINADTWADFAPRVLGGNWQSQNVRDFGVQDKVAKAIFESTKGDPKALMGRWASLNAAEAQRAAKLPWEQARNIIAQGESGVGDVTKLARGAVVIPSVIQRNSQADPLRDFTIDVGKNWSNGASAIEVAGELMKGPLAGADQKVVNAEIRRIAQDYNVNPAIAGRILVRSMTEGGIIENNAGTGWLGQKIVQATGGRRQLGNGYVIDAKQERMLGNAVKKDGGRQLAQTALTTTQEVGAIGNIGQAMQALQQARATLAQRQLLVSSGRKKLDLSADYARVAQLEALVGQIQESGKGVAIRGATGR